MSLSCLPKLISGHFNHNKISGHFYYSISGHFKIDEYAVAVIHRVVYFFTI